MISMCEAVQRLAFHEGCVLKPYKDTHGLWTIGIGRCTDKNPFTTEELRAVGPNWKSEGITKNAAYMLLRNDIRRILRSLKEKIAFWYELDDERQYALLDMAFQMGVNGVLRFKKMLAAMGVGNWIEAKAECLDSNYGREFKTRALRIAGCIATGKFIM